MNSYEIDRFDYTSCPFNSSHRFSSEQYQYHILRCKDRQFPHVINNIQQCPHNNLHYFINPFALSYHIPRCPDYPGRAKYSPASFGSAPKEIEYLNCPFNPLHGIKSGEPASFSKHLAECPNKDSAIGHNPVPTPAIDKSLSGQLNYKHGLISSEEVFIEVPKVSITRTQSVQIHFMGRVFSAYKEDRGSGLEEIDLWVNYFTSADPREWPGLKLLEDNRSHASHLVGYLYQDKGDSANRFSAFVKYLNNDCNKKIAPCFQASSEKNRVIFIVHRSEETGFGGAIGSASEIGVFYLQHSMLYNTVSLVHNLQNVLQSERHEKNEIKNTLIKLEEDKRKLIEEYNVLRMEFDIVKTKEKETKELYENKVNEYWRECYNARNKAFSDTEALKRDGEIERKELMIQLEKIINEKNTMQMNFYSESQKFKNIEKKQHDRILELLNDVEELKKNNKELQDNISFLQNRVSDERKRYIGADINTIVENRVKEERELMENMYLDKELCTVCVSEKKNVVFLPCGHFSYCHLCLRSLGIEIGKKILASNTHSRCPVCQSVVEKVVKAYPF